MLTLGAFRTEVVGTPTPTNVPKSGHVVSASVVDSSGSELFEVGSHITDATVRLDVWVITGDSNGNTYSDHNLRAYGPAGQNETKTTGRMVHQRPQQWIHHRIVLRLSCSLLLSISTVPTWIVPGWLHGLTLTPVLVCQQTERLHLVLPFTSSTERQ